MPPTPAKRSRRKPRTSPVVAAAPLPALDAASRVDAPLVASAMRKLAMQQQDQLTREERSALKRHEKAREEKLRWQYYRAIPQKHWREMSGRQTKVINEQADRYGLPFGGPTVDLPKFVRAFHNFLAENALKLAKEDDPLLAGAGGSSPALEDYRRERAMLARLERLEREKVLLPRGEVREAMGRIAAIVRGAGDTLQRQFGPAAVEILYEALSDAQREISRSFGDTDGNGEQRGTESPQDA